MYARRLIIGATVIVALLWAPDVASAHGDDGAMDVQSSAQSGPNTIRLLVTIPYQDGDLATSATVKATLEGPDGTVIPGVPVPAVGSGYGTELTVTKPGRWRIAIASVNPAAEATVEVMVEPESAGSPVIPANAAPRHLWSSSTALVIVLVGATAATVVGGLVLRRRRARTG